MSEDEERLEEERLYEEARERLRPYYGEDVDKMEDADLDECEGLLDEFAEKVWRAAQRR